MFDMLLGQGEVAEVFNQLAPPLQIALLLGAMSIAVSLLVSVTAFTRIIIVLSFVRRALTTQEIPPNPVILGLSGFLTLYVMAPTFENIYENAVRPYLAAQANKDAKDTFSLSQAGEIAANELKAFMIHNTRESDLELFVSLANRNQDESIAEGGQVQAAARASLGQMNSPTSPTTLELPGSYGQNSSNNELVFLENGEIDLARIKISTLIPAFIISELKTAFIMGFCIYIPFLLIDLVVSTVLMSLGMMMMPPVVVATPCKLLLFVLVDGWQLIAQALVTSFNS